MIVWQRSSFYKFAVGVVGVLLLFGAWIWLVMQNAVNHEATGNLHRLTRLDYFRFFMVLLSDFKRKFKYPAHDFCQFIDFYDTGLFFVLERGAKEKTRL